MNNDKIVYVLVTNGGGMDGRDHTDKGGKEIARNPKESEAAKPEKLDTEWHQVGDKMALVNMQTGAIVKEFDAAGKESKDSALKQRIVEEGGKEFYEYYDEKDPSKGDYRKYDADSPNTFKGKYVPDPAAKAQAITRKAEAGARFYRWLDQNPKATEQQVKDFIWNDSQESIRAGLPDQYQKGWDFISGPVQDARAAAVIQGTSVKPASAPDPMNAPNTSTGNTEGGTEGEATFFQGGKITSYGYKNDETPDQNSSDGIGAFVPDAEAKKIRAGQDSTYKLRAGDLAISPDVEESFREKGIKPGDRVTITYGNGSKHTGRWMDRTANDKQAEKLGLKPLRGRFDIYSPNGRHAKDGVKVVSFARVG